MKKLLMTLLLLATVNCVPKFSDIEVAYHGKTRCFSVYGVSVFVHNTACPAAFAIERHTRRFLGRFGASQDTLKGVQVVFVPNTIKWCGEDGHFSGCATSPSTAFVHQHLDWARVYGHELGHIILARHQIHPHVLHYDPVLERAAEAYGTDKYQLADTPWDGVFQ